MKRSKGEKKSDARSEPSRCTCARITLCPSRIDGVASGVGSMLAFWFPVAKKMRPLPSEVSPPPDCQIALPVLRAAPLLVASMLLIWPAGVMPTTQAGVRADVQWLPEPGVMTPSISAAGRGRCLAKKALKVVPASLLAVPWMRRGG